MKKVLSVLFLILGFMFAFGAKAFAYYYGPTWNVTPIYVHIPEDKQTVTMEHAFQRWEKVSLNKLRFEFVDNEDDADITVEFVDDIDGSDGEVGAYALTVQGNLIKKANIQIINNDDKKYSDDMMFTTMLHEIGHAIGLSDSGRNFGIMRMPVNENQDIVKRDMIMLYKLYGWSTMPNGTYRY